MPAPRPRPPAVRSAVAGAAFPALRVTTPWYRPRRRPVGRGNRGLRDRLAPTGHGQRPERMNANANLKTGDRKGPYGGTKYPS
jgi:hypothetical protein